MLRTSGAELVIVQLDTPGGLVDRHARHGA